jgi:hypothetical protein
VKGAGWGDADVDRPAGHAIYDNPINSDRRRAGSHYADPETGLETVEAWECEPSCVIRRLDDMSGERPVSGSAKNGRPASSTGDGERNVYGNGLGHQGTLHNDSGGASRYFQNFPPADPDFFPAIYCPKASRRDRGPGNTHPTCKSQMLMRWLVKLITSPGGTVLDPFAGSGSTLLACMAEGFDGIGVEENAEYHAIAEARIDAARSATPLLDGPTR